MKYKERASCASKFAEYQRPISITSESDSNKVILLKPHTFMNIIGKNVKQALKAFSIPKEQIIVLHDDLEQKLGKYRIVKSTSFKGHNGLKSI